MITIGQTFAYQLAMFQLASAAALLQQPPGVALWPQQHKNLSPQLYVIYVMLVLRTVYQIGCIVRVLRHRFV